MMQLLRRTFKQHLVYGIYAVAIVSTLLVYQKGAIGNRLVVEGQHCYPKENCQKDDYAIASANISPKCSQIVEKLLSFDSRTTDQINYKQSVSSKWDRIFWFTFSRICR